MGGERRHSGLKTYKVKIFGINDEEKFSVKFYSLTTCSRNSSDEVNCP
jgi:hypothetical protein